MNLSVTVEKVWPGAHGGAVFTGRDDTGKIHRILASGKVIHRAPQRGESWTVLGELAEHPRYGWQLQASHAALTPLPSGEHLKRFLAQNRAFHGIGEVRAEKLWSAFGDGLFALLDAQDRVPLIEVLGSEEVVDGLLETWAEQRAEAEVIRWLEDQHFPVRLGAKVLRLWGAEAPAKLEENPYRMLALAGWQKVDAAALDLGVGADAEIRRIAAVEAACYQAMSRRHTLVEEDELLRIVSRLLGQPKEGAREALQLAEQDFAVIPLGNGRWQALGPYTMESYVQERIAQMVAGEHVPSGNLLFQVPSDAEVDALLASFQDETGLKITAEQQQAVWLALTQRCSLTCGGAGTGKTTMLRAVIHAFERQGGTVHPVALAGRAACRITEATGHPARTLAGFLGAIQREELCLGDGHLVVVDESSMVDLPLAYALVSSIPADCRVLWVGDPYQLPPIGMGIVFAAYCSPGDDRMPKVELTKVHRQAAETGIPHFAGLIREGFVPTLPNCAGPGQGISFVNTDEQDALALVIEILGDLHGPQQCQILSAIKNGPIGTKSINAALHKLRVAGREEWQGYSSGDPVIWLENDYERRLFNGTLGMVQAVDLGSATVLWDGHDSPMTLGYEDLGSLDLAYAITVHKSQGSQFRRVIIPVFKTRLLDRTLVYTAITRASEQVVLIGDPVALRQAVEAPPVPLRRLHGLGLAGTRVEG